MNAHRRPVPAVIGPIVRPVVRRWLYGVAAAAAPLVTIYGLVTNEQAVLWLNLVGAVLFTMALGNTPSRPEETTEGEV